MYRNQVGGRRPISSAQNWTDLKAGGKQNPEVKLTRKNMFLTVQLNATPRQIQKAGPTI